MFFLPSLNGHLITFQILVPIPPPRKCLFWSTSLKSPPHPLLSSLLPYLFPGGSPAEGLNYPLFQSFRVAAWASEQHGSLIFQKEEQTPKFKMFSSIPKSFSSTGPYFIFFAPLTLRNYCASL